LATDGRGEIPSTTHGLFRGQVTVGGAIVEMDATVDVDADVDLDVKGNVPVITGGENGTPGGVKPEMRDRVGCTKWRQKG
jgi:hypothetical protein